MPRETIEIAVYKAAPAEAVSRLMSFVAYPDPRDKEQRERFEISLYRTALMYRAELDAAWGKSIQQVKPYVFLDDEKTYLASLR